MATVWEQSREWPGAEWRELWGVGAAAAAAAAALGKRGRREGGLKGGSAPKRS